MLRVPLLLAYVFFTAFVIESSSYSQDNQTRKVMEMRFLRELKDKNLTPAGPDKEVIINLYDDKSWSPENADPRFLAQIVNRNWIKTGNTIKLNATAKDTNYSSKLELTLLPDGRLIGENEFTIFRGSYKEIDHPDDSGSFAREAVKIIYDKLAEMKSSIANYRKDSGNELESLKRNEQNLEKMINNYMKDNSAQIDRIKRSINSVKSNDNLSDIEKKRIDGLEAKMKTMDEKMQSFSNNLSMIRGNLNSGNVDIGNLQIIIQNITNNIDGFQREKLIIINEIGTIYESTFALIPQPFRDYLKRNPGWLTSVSSADIVDLNDSSVMYISVGSARKSSNDPRTAARLKADLEMGKITAGDESGKAKIKAAFRSIEGDNIVKEIEERVESDVKALPVVAEWSWVDVRDENRQDRVPMVSVLYGKVVDREQYLKEARETKK